MDLERADAGRQVDDGGQAARFECLHQRVHTEAQLEVQHWRAELDQQ